MGRGGQSEAMIAKELLYGRRSSNLSDRRKRQARQELRHAKKVKQKENYSQRVVAAEAELARGRTILLAELLDNPAGHGLKGLENKLLLKTARELLNLSIYAGNPKDSAAEPMESLEDISNLFRLFDRVRQQKISAIAESEIDGAIEYYGQALAHQQVIDLLEKEKDQIGALPLLYFGEDFSDHLAAGDKALCGTRPFIVSGGRRKPALDRSILDGQLDCGNCLNHYLEHSDQLDLVEPNDWLGAVKRRDLNDFCELDAGPITNDDGSPTERAERLVAHHQDFAYEVLTDRLDWYNDYYIGE